VRQGDEPAAVTSLCPPPTSRTVVPSRGLAIAVSTWGDVDRARLVLLAAHGYLDCAEFFAPLAARLRGEAPALAVMAMSFAGHGTSSWAGSYGWFDATADLVTVARRVRRLIPPGCAFGLVGHSFGGLQMLQALALEDLAADLVVNLDAVAAPASPAASEGFGPGIRYLAERVARPRRLPVYDTVEELVARRLRSNPRLDPRVLTALAPYYARPAGSGWTWRVDPVLAGRVRPWEVLGQVNPEPLELLAAVPGPVLTVTGTAQDHSDLRGRYPGDDELRRLPNVDHVSVAGAGHYMHLEQPELVASVILERAETIVAGLR
jgi:pimeloyl-ACP methyl ester carboxylesterase